jgi:hypothetical protein
MTLLTLKQASQWAAEYFNKKITESNISYLIQYGKIKKHKENGQTSVDIEDLKKYYSSFYGKRELLWKEKLGEDLNWALSFDNYKEKETTKHVHRLHPYKGKFIPQLVEYFLDSHTDNFKKVVFFKKGDIVLDPFSGSGTTLVQANELGIHSIGVDVSRFNTLISEVKLLDYDFAKLKKTIDYFKEIIKNYPTDKKILLFEKELEQKILAINDQYFSIKKKDNDLLGKEKEKIVLNFYHELIKKYNVDLINPSPKNFLDKWYFKNIRQEIDFVFNEIKKIKDSKIKKIMAIILSRTIRSCRATAHSDLATLKTPQITPYYCYKHKKICKPLMTIKNWFYRYADDTYYRLIEFSKIKTKAFWTVITADSRTVDIFNEVEKINQDFYSLLKKQKIQGIFTSPPYVGQIDYHEQHAYSYDLFGFERKDELEIGPLYKGQGEEARKSYIEGISQVIINCRKYLVDDPDIFLVANDKFNLYPIIAEKSGLVIVNQFKRPVLNRTERDKSPYSEIIFHLKYDKK